MLRQLLAFLLLPFRDQWLEGAPDAAVYQSISDVPELEWDFIIAGGGTAGAVLANRLSEVSSYNVLLIEAGPSNEGILESQVPFMHSRLMTSPYDWKYTTVPQSGLNGRTIDYARGRVLGGSSSINFMFYTRGTEGDYNRWAVTTGDDGWSWKNMKQYFLKNERWVPPADGHNTRGQHDPAAHNKNGMVAVSLPGYPQDTSDTRSLEAAAQLGSDFKYNADVNSGNPLGLTWNQLSNGNGIRSSSATSYLAKKYLGRRNLHVVVNAHVTRVLPTDGIESCSEFKSVEVTDSRGRPNHNAKRHVFKARKEVILSAGAIGSPTIMLNSGIGDASDLKAVGIKPLVHLPSVGKNLSDHFLTYVTYSAKSNRTFDAFLNSPSDQARALDQWRATKRGPLLAVGEGMNQIIWRRIPDSSPLWKAYPDPMPDKTTPHVELIVTNSRSFSRLPGPHLSFVLVGLTPSSIGSVKLRSRDPLAAPLIDPGYFTNEFDVHAMLFAVRSVQEFLKAPVWKEYVGEHVAPFTPGTIGDDEEVMKSLRKVTGTAWHPVGTLKMSKKGETWGVVDPDLRVKGLKGLRVVDASVMPFITASHTQAPVYAIAERASDLIKAAWSK